MLKKLKKQNQSMEPLKRDSHKIEININETKFIFIFGLIYDDYLLMNLRK
jgi:hypothetical protein